VSTIATPPRDHAPPEHELKLALPALQAASVVIWLRARCLPDPRYPDGRVTSIYYDDRNMTRLREKINSDFVKQKVRLRWYSHPATGALFDPAFVELKRKVGGRRFKTRVPLDLPVASLAAPHAPSSLLRQALATLRNAGHWVDTDLQPFLQIGFRRHRFIDPCSGSRISVDSHISGASVNAGMLPQSNPAPLAHAVVEVKGPRATLPASLAFLRHMGCRPESFSKYARCYQKLTRRWSF